MSSRSGHPVVRIHAIAINTFREAVRDRVLYGMLGMACAVLVFTLALGELSLDHAPRVIEDVGLACISLFGVIIAVFLGSSLLYKEIERKTLYVILPKPLNRWEFLVGKFAGITLTGSVFVAIMGAILVLVVAAQAGSATLPLACVGVVALVFGGALHRLRDPARVLSWWWLVALGAAVLVAYSAEVDPVPVLAALVLNVGELFLLAALALLFGSFSTPFLTGMFTIGTWLLGRSADAMQTMSSRALSDELEAILHGLARVVPNFNLFVPGYEMLHGDEATVYVASNLAYALTYGTALLVLASLVFRRRDFA